MKSHRAASRRHARRAGGARAPRADGRRRGVRLSRRRATIVDVKYYDPLVMRARLAARHATTRSASSRPWPKRRLRELVKPTRRARLHQRRDRARLPRRHPAEADRRPSRARRPRRRRRSAARTSTCSARWTVAGVADRPLGGPGVSRALAARGQAQARAGLPLVLPAHRRGRQGLDRLARTTYARSRAASAEADEARAHARSSCAARAPSSTSPRPGHALARRPGGDAVRREDRAEHADRGDVHEPATRPRRRERSRARSRSRSRAG